MSKAKIAKKILCLCMVLLISINGFASSIGSNDGSAFITKAEFDSLKNNFQSQIDSYNQSIDSKIDAAIAAYLTGISVTRYRYISLDINQNLGFPIYSCVGKESSKHTYKESGDARFDLSLPNVELQSATIAKSTASSNGSQGLQLFTGNTTGISPNGNYRSVIDVMLQKTHSDPVVGKYETAVWDNVKNIWRTNGYMSGYIKIGDEKRVQDLTTSTQTSNWSRSGVYSEISSNWNSPYRYIYCVMFGCDATNLNSASDTSTCTDWYGDTVWRGAMHNWYRFDSFSYTDNQKKLMDNWDGKNLTLTDFKTMITNAGLPFTVNACSTTIGTSTERKRFESESKRNKIYSGADAYVNAYPESNIWCYRPVKVGGKWKSDEYKITLVSDYIVHVENITSVASGCGAIPYDPWYPMLTPALDGATNDETFAKDAKFSIIKADKLYWTDDNGDDHKFNEGLFITKFTDDGGLTGKFKFSEASNEKVWCAFSKKPFDGTWTNADALPVTVKVAGVKQTISDFKYECGKEYTFTLENISKNDKIYMLFKSSSGTKNPSLDYLKDLQVFTEEK